jgi:hypothetical protein
VGKEGAPNKRDGLHTHPDARTVESLSLSVTSLLRSVSKSMVMPKGTPTSSARAYRRPTDTPVVSARLEMPAPAQDNVT